MKHHTKNRSQWAAALKTVVVSSATIMMLANASAAKELVNHFDNKSRSELISVMADGYDLVPEGTVPSESKKYGFAHYTSNCAEDAKVVFKFDNYVRQSFTLDSCKAYNFTIRDNLDENASASRNNLYVIEYTEIK